MLKPQESFKTLKNAPPPVFAAALAAALGTLCTIASQGCATRKLDSGVKSAAPKAIDKIDPDWLAEQKKKNAELKEYIEKRFINNELGDKLDAEALKDSPFNWFQNFPLGFSGPPLALLKSFSAITDPEVRKLFGTPEEFLKPAGFGRMPPKDFDDAKKHSLPLGLGYTHSDPQANPKALLSNQKSMAESFKPPVALAVVTCGACHIGRVQFREQEVKDFQISNDVFFGFDKATQSLYMVGAPNTEFDPNHFRHTLERFRTYMLQLEETNRPLYNANIEQMKKYIMNASDEEIYGSSNSAIDFLNSFVKFGFKKADIFFIANNLESVLKKLFEKIQSRVDFNSTMIATNQSLGAGYAGPVDLLPARDQGGPLTLNGAAPGQLDAFNLANSVLLAEELKDPQKRSKLLNKSPAMSDLMSTWTQKIRPYGNWNGNMQDHFYRNLGASFGGVADAAMVDPTNVYIATQFLLSLPSPRYPFPVDTAKTNRGLEVFTAKCSACHGTYNNKDTSPKNNFGWAISRAQGADDKEPLWLDVGTDMGRALAQTQEGIDVMVNGLREGCKARTEKADTHHVGMELILPQIRKSCNKATDDEIGVRADKVRKGYVPLNLTGIWARAPYLHNGSVPTLYQLLSPPEKRTKAFWRGVPYYDRNEVGFVWNEEQLNSLNQTEQINWLKDYPTAALYDTAQPGRSNQGHYNLRLNEETGTADSNGNWPAPGSEDQLALLEFLKTL